MCDQYLDSILNERYEYRYCNLTQLSQITRSGMELSRQFGLCLSSCLTTSHYNGGERTFTFRKLTFRYVYISGVSIYTYDNRDIKK